MKRDNSRFGSSSSSRNYGSGRSVEEIMAEAMVEAMVDEMVVGDFKRQKREEWTCGSCMLNFMDRLNCRRCGSKVTPQPYESEWW